jgi:hypothetical protein
MIKTTDPFYSGSTKKIAKKKSKKKKAKPSKKRSKY